MSPYPYQSQLLPGATLMEQNHTEHTTSLGVDTSLSDTAQQLKTASLPLPLRQPTAEQATCFPVRLHMMLSDIAERGAQSHVISWQPHGRCFVVHDKDKFVLEILPRWFRQSHWASFQRQLNIYGFSRLSHGPDKGGYYHKQFLQHHPVMATYILRHKLKGTGHRKAARPENEPNFYTMIPTVCLPGSAHNVGSNTAEFLDTQVIQFHAAPAPALTITSVPRAMHTTTAPAPRAIIAPRNFQPLFPPLVTPTQGRSSAPEVPAADNASTTVLLVLPEPTPMLPPPQLPPPQTAPQSGSQRTNTDSEDDIEDIDLEDAALWSFLVFNN